MEQGYVADEHLLVPEIDVALWPDRRHDLSVLLHATFGDGGYEHG